METGVLGQFEATGIRPRFIDHMASRGIHLAADLFRPDRRLG